MSSNTYARLRDSATRMLAKYGAIVVIRRTDMDGSVNSWETRALFQARVTHVLPGSNVNIGDWSVLLAADATPKPGDRLLQTGEGAEQFVIVDPVEPIKPANTVLAYECFARTG